MCFDVAWLLLLSPVCKFIYILRWAKRKSVPNLFYFHSCMLYCCWDWFMWGDLKISKSEVLCSRHDEDDGIVWNWKISCIKFHMSKRFFNFTSLLLFVVCVWELKAELLSSRILPRIPFLSLLTSFARSRKCSHGSDQSKPSLLVESIIKVLLWH